MFGKEFIVLKKLPGIFEKVGDNYPEFFWVHEDEKTKELEYCIMDDNFGQPSPANTHNGEYAKKLRKRCDVILKRLLEEGFIEYKK